MPINHYVFKDVYPRLCSVFGTKTQEEFARRLGLRQASVADNKRRGVIPARWVLFAVEHYGINPAWLRTGCGPMYIVPSLHSFFYENENPL